MALEVPEEATPALQNAANPVGMIREAVAAHMMIGMAIVAAVEDTAIAMVPRGAEVEAIWSLSDHEMEATETETATAADHPSRNLERGHTRATATQRILASCGGTRCTRTSWFVLWWVSRLFSISSLHQQG